MRDQPTAADEFDWGEGVATFGDRLARAREVSGMEQATLARRLGVRAVTIANWEADRSEPRANRLQMLAGLLNVSIIWLMTGEGEGAPEPPAPLATDLSEIVAELGELRQAQAQLAERAGRIEKRLRTLAAR